VVVDKLTYSGSLKNIAQVAKNPRFFFVNADISDRKEVEAIFRKYQPHALLNFAAETHVDRSIDDPSAFIQTNFVGTYDLLEVSRQYLSGASGKTRSAFRFLHVSTDEVYGSLGSTGLFSEESPYAPNSPYSATKAGADHLVRAYYETYKLPVLVTNTSNNYGPYQFPEKLIPLVILNAVEGKDLPIYGDGKNVRDWIFVEDHCEGIHKVLQEGRPGENYNLGAKDERPNIEVVDLICRILEELHPAKDNKALQARKKKNYSSLKKFVPDRPGHDRRYAIDPSKVFRELKWKPKNKFESGLKKTVQWYLDHREWCEAVQEGPYQRERLGLSKEAS